MANAYPILYRLGVTPWEANRDDGPLAEVLATRPPGRALDAGCGTGRHAVSIAEHGWTVTGVDGVSQALRKASARAESAGVGDRATFVQGDVAHLDSVLGEERYDLVLDIGCFHGLTDPDRIAFAGWVTSHTADGAVLLLHTVLPRSGIGPRGIDDAGVRAAFGPAWSLSTTESTTTRPAAHRQGIRDHRNRRRALRRRADGGALGCARSPRPAPPARVVRFTSAILNAGAGGSSREPVPAACRTEAFGRAIGRTGQTGHPSSVKRSPRQGRRSPNTRV